MNWLIDNREWLFSGAGVVIIVALVRLFITRAKLDQSNPQVSHAEDNSQQQPARPSPSIPPPVGPVLRKTLREIYDEIHGAPYLQQEEVENRYLGARLRVEGRVDFICKSDDGKVAVKMIEGKDHWPHAWFEVTLAEHPEVKFMKKDTPLVVEGVFNEFQYGDFRLKDGRIIDYETPTNESNATSG